MLRSSLARACILEVERKFHSLTVRDLVSNSGDPPFRRIQKLDQRIIHDAYYDRSNLLASAGVWVRRRNGKWEAKVKNGGDYTNSKFEELVDPHDISKCVQDIIGIACTEGDQFGLERIATLSTLRKSWIADDDFRIVLDTLDFGHVVGEVELQQQKEIIATANMSVEQQKQSAMQEMDSRIAKFMEQYSWAFHPGVPKGKLTAYFERKSS